MVSEIYVNVFASPETSSAGGLVGIKHISNSQLNTNKKYKV